MEHAKVVAEAPTLLPSAHMPAPAVMAILSRFERDQLASFITVAVDLLDAIDGDPDLEVEDPAGETVPVIGDPLLQPEEDDGDPDLEETDCEDSFVLSGNALSSAQGAGCNIADPDCGVDDQGEGIDEREPDEATEHTNYGVDQTKPPLSPYLTDDASLRRPFVERARREKCVRLNRPDAMGCTFQLVEG